MLHIDLFSGIGGFAYAAQQVWPDYHNLFFCDCNKFCQAVLRKNFGQDSLIYGDIREVNVERVIKDTIGCGCTYREPNEEAAEIRGQRITGAGDGDGIFPEQVDLLTGGFPCQPFSAAGKRKGRDDDRHLWPEMFRVIKAFRPRWVIGENVRGLINIENGMALEQVFLDLESIGYTVQAFIIPACAVNAPHRRDRIWIVAHADNRGDGREIRETLSGGQGQAVADSELGGGNSGGGGVYRQGESDRHAADGQDERCEGRGEAQRWDKPNRSRRDEMGDEPCGQGWEQPWLEIATRLCRVDDGLPAIMDGTTISKSKHREERLKALGNAIVPQVAIEIMKAIRDSDKEFK